MRNILTKQEQTILDLLIAGTSPKEIGYQLNISYNTVKYHRKNLYEKMGVHSIEELFGKYAFASTADEKEILSSQSLPTPFELVLNLNPPYGGFYAFEPDVFQYDGKWYPSPFKLGKDNRLVEGDLWLVNCFFTANVDLNYITVSFIDTTIEEDEFHTELSGPYVLGHNGLKANTRYSLSTKIVLDKTASGTKPNENMFHFQTGCFAESPQIISFHKFEVIKLPWPNSLTNLLPPGKRSSLTKLPVPNPLTIALDFDTYVPWNTWKYILNPDTFIYEGKQAASPFILGKGNRIVKDSIFIVTCFFTSNIDLIHLEVVFVDNTLPVNGNWTPLSPYLKLEKNIKAQTEYCVTKKLLITMTASGTTPAENQFRLYVRTETKEQPILSFTKFEVVKI